MSLFSSAFVRWALLLPMGGCIAVLLTSNDLPSRLVALLALLVMGQAREILFMQEMSSAFEEGQRLKEERAHSQSSAQSLVASSAPNPALASAQKKGAPSVSSEPMIMMVENKR